MVKNKNEEEMVEKRKEGEMEKNGEEIVGKRK